MRTTKPLLTEPDDIDAYSIALAESSLMEAWHYQRTFPEGSSTRTRIIHNIFGWCLTRTSYFTFISRTLSHCNAEAKPRAKPLAKLLAFPFSSYEQSLLHEYALNPPLELPIPSLPVVQDLACTRLIQGGHLAAAVKLDRKFAITPIRGIFTSKLSDQARKVISDRKQIVEEILAVMPPAERTLLEVELELMGQEGEADSKSPDTRSPRMNGEAKRGPRRPAVDAPILPNIPQRSGAPRFGGPIPANASFAAVREMYEAISAGKPLAQRDGSPKTLAQEDTDPIIDSQDAPSTGVKPGDSGETSVSARVRSSKSPNHPQTSTSISAPSRQGSLFESKGSANRTPNAFFKPTSTGPSVGSKRPRPEESSRRPAMQPADAITASTQDIPQALHEVPEEDADVDMQEPELEPAQRPEPIEDSPLGRKSRAGYSSSVFAVAEDFEMEPQPQASASYKTPSATPAPPGAFASEVEDAIESEPSNSAKTQPETQADSPPPSPVQSRIPTRKQPARLSRSQSSHVDLSRSVPGAFIDEEEDIVPPLPTPRQTRKLRTSRAADDKSAPKMARRSSRLSARSASERGSSSPEPEPVLAASNSAKTRRSSAKTPATPSKSRARKHH